VKLVIVALGVLINSTGFTPIVTALVNQSRVTPEGSGNPFNW
jgi:hypothetical protein